MQTKGEYTPGPWSVHTEDDSSISRARSVYICTEQGWPDGQLARVNVQDGLGEREANACLIAAAPELLTKVEIAATIFDEYARLHSAKGTADGDQKAKRNLEYAAEMRTAIARAKGLPS